MLGAETFLGMTAAAAAVGAAVAEEAVKGTFTLAGREAERSSLGREEVVGVEGSREGLREALGVTALVWVTLLLLPPPLWV